MAKAKLLEVLTDTNWVLDIFLPNRPISAAELQASKDLWQANDQRKIVAYISASSLPDVFYITERHSNTNCVWCW